MFRKVILFIMILFLQGCYNSPDFVKPASWLFDQVPKDAPNVYKLAWRDGCESGLSSMSNTMYKTFYSFKQDAKLRSNPVYYKTWKDTYTFCRHYIYGTIRQANIRMNLPNKRPGIMTSFMGTEGILNHGPLNLWGRGGTTDLMFLGGVGKVGGNLGDPVGAGGMWDFSGEAVGVGKGGSVFDWDFTK